jgi:hypothetical protein
MFALNIYIYFIAIAVIIIKMQNIKEKQRLSRGL